MWNQFSIDISHYLPQVPQKFHASVGSTFLAAVVGGAYGLLGRVIYPKAGISPLHYAAWFVLAFQIKQFVLSIEAHFSNFLGVSAYFEELEEVSEDDLDFHDLIRYHCWKVIHLKTSILTTIDQAFCLLFHARPYTEVTSDNVEEASFLEMCRYRMWPIFKLTVLDTVCFALAHRMSNLTGFSVPDRTAVPLFIVIRSIVKDIILVPALYVYARVCNRIADGLEEGDEISAAYRVEWIRWCLPKL